MTLIDLFVSFILLLALVPLLLSVWYAIRWSGRWRVAAALPFMFLLLWVLAVVADWPVEHTLWPFELVVLSPVCLLYVAVVRYGREWSLEQRKWRNVRRR